MGTERPNLDDEFQEADDAILEDTTILQEVEYERRDVPVGDPVHVDLSEIAADTARDLRDQARQQRGASRRLAGRRPAVALPLRLGTGDRREAGAVVSLPVAAQLPLRPPNPATAAAMLDQA